MNRADVTALAKTARANVSPAAVTKKRKKIAMAIAVLADLLQMGMFEVFMPGALSPPDDVLDVVMVVLLTLILGFRWRLVFAFVLELTPGAALFPSWTGFVMSLPTIPDQRALSELPAGESAKTSTSTPSA